MCTSYIMCSCTTTWRIYHDIKNGVRVCISAHNLAFSHFHFHLGDIGCRLQKRLPPIATTTQSYKCIYCMLCPLCRYPQWLFLYAFSFYPPLLNKTPPFSRPPLIHRHYEWIIVPHGNSQQLAYRHKCKKKDRKITVVLWGYFLCEWLVSFLYWFRMKLHLLCRKWCLCYFRVGWMGQHQCNTGLFMASGPQYIQ